jgi:hypothetical protein
MTPARVVTSYAPFSGEPEYLAIEEYRKLVSAAGFETLSVAERVVMLFGHSPREHRLVRGRWPPPCSGHPVDRASEALQRAAGPALAWAGVEARPRNWLEIVAVKRRAAPHRVDRGDGITAAAPR